MQSLTVNNDLRDAFRKAAELVEIRDDAGQILGFFAPVSLEQAKHYAAAAAHFKPDQIKRPTGDNGHGISTRDLLEGGQRH